ncbi:hypothetical protein AGMMS49975_16300 [Clostridia bacterium]|nr:hypothetical protein AGMMS49975_16300 [Clostridia bacterium]
MRKTLVLGAGGTGASAIRRIQDLVEWRQTDPAENLKNIQFLEIDTDPASFADYGHNFVPLTVSAGDADRFKEEASKGHHQWAERGEIDAISDGAGATRTKGKEGFLLHYDQIADEIKMRLEKLYTNQIQPNDMDEDQKIVKTKIYIVANSVSGTGSGCFVDFGYLVKKLIKENQVFHNDPTLDLTLILTLPTRMDDPAKLRNSFFALEELNHYMSGNVYKTEHATSLGTFLTSSAEERPFDYVYLVGPKQTRPFNNQELENIIGEYIYNDIFSPSADKRDGRRDDMKPFMKIGRKDKLGYVQCYMTFGFSTIEYPAMQIAKLASCQYIKKALTEWRQDLPSDNPYAYDTLFMESGSHKNTGSIYSQLIKEIKIDIPGDKAYVTNLNNMIFNLKKETMQRFEKSDYDTNVLFGLKAALDAGFESPDGIMNGSYRKGIVRVVISENSKILANSANFSWHKLIKTNLLEYMFNNQGGLGVVKSVVNKILDTHLNEIASKTVDTTNSEEAKKKMDNVIANIKSIHSDWLLLPGGLRKTPLIKLARKYETALDSYIQARLEETTVNAAKELVVTLRTKIEQFKKNIDEFDNYTNKWIDDIVRDIDSTSNLRLLNGHVVMQSSIPTIANEIIVSSRRRTDDFIKGTLRNTFKPFLEKDRSAFPPNLRKKALNDERKTFVSALNAENKNVVEEFFREEDNKNQAADTPKDFVKITSRETHDKSDLFINIIQSDKDFDRNRQIDEKEWFFYPGGSTINNSGDSEENRYAEILDSLNLIKDWGQQSQDSYDAYTILFLRERGCFPVRFLNILKDDQMKDAVARTRDFSSERISNTYLSRIDVDFLPLDIIDGAKLNELKLKLLLSIVVGVLETNGVAFVYADDKSKKQVFEEFEDVRVSIPSEYKAGVYRLYSKYSHILETLDKKIEESITKGPSLDFIERLYKFALSPTTFGLVLGTTKDEMDRNKREISALLKDYIKSKPDILKAWNGVYEDAPIDEKSSEFYRYFKRPDENHTSIGWYCKRCNTFLGDKQSGGEPDLSVLPEFDRTHVCNR